MPGGREISGGDIHAALRNLGPGRGDLAALCAAIGPEETVATYEDLLMVCPPARIGLTAGAHAALFAPLFGEFE